MPRVVAPTPHLYHWFLPRCCQPAPLDGDTAIEPVHGHFLEHAIHAIHFCVYTSFIVGSVCFLPDWSEWLEFGCEIFIVASLIFCVLVVVDLAEMLLRRYAYGGDHSESPLRVTRKEIAERCILFVGAVLFAVGTVFYLPARGPANPEQHDHQLRIGCAMFLTGSFCFWLGVWINGMTLHHTHPDFRIHAQLIASQYLMGGLLFVVGSVAIYPHVPPELELFGVWCFIIGSCFYVSGCVHGFVKDRAIETIWDEQRHHTAHLVGVAEEGTQQQVDITSPVIDARAARHLHRMGIRPESFAAGPRPVLSLRAGNAQSASLREPLQTTSLQEAPTSSHGDHLVPPRPCSFAVEQRRQSGDSVYTVGPCPASVGVLEVLRSRRDPNHTLALGSFHGTPAVVEYPEEERRGTWGGGGDRAPSGSAARAV